MLPSNPDWANVRGQLREYMNRVRLAEGDRYRICGITTIRLYPRLAVHNESPKQYSGKWPGTLCQLRGSCWQRLTLHVIVDAISKIDR
jgi:hypothetical protein